MLEEIKQIVTEIINRKIYGMVLLILSIYFTFLFVKTHSEDLDIFYKILGLLSVAILISILATAGVVLLLF